MSPLWWSVFAGLLLFARSERATTKENGILPSATEQTQLPEELLVDPTAPWLMDILGGDRLPLLEGLRGKVRCVEVEEILRAIIYHLPPGSLMELHGGTCPRNCLFPPGSLPIYAPVEGPAHKESPTFIKFGCAAIAWEYHRV